MELVSAIAGAASALGVNGILLFFLKRYIAKKDAAQQAEEKKTEELLHRLEIGIETIRLLAYCRMSEEIERLLTQGYATPAERKVLEEMFANYKAHGWNGDMDARLEKVYRLRTDAPHGGM